MDRDAFGWIEAATQDGRFAHVEGLLPPVFEAYARVLHPIESEAGTRTRWGDLAIANGRTPHALMDFYRIVIPATDAIPELPDLNRHGTGRRRARFRCESARF